MATEDFPQITEDSPDWLKNLRKEHREMKGQLKELAPVARENAILKAGIDLKNPVAELFVEGYKGELTPEAIKEAAAKYGLAEAPAADGGTGEAAGDDSGQAAEAAALQAINDAAAGAGSPAGSTPDYLEAQDAKEFLAKYRASGGLVADL